MEINILSSDKNSLKVEFIGEDHTFANAIRKQLWENPKVKLAGYNIEHPLVGNPVLIIDCDGKEDPKKALLKAAEQMKKKNIELISKLKNVKE